MYVCYFLNMLILTYTFKGCNMTLQLNLLQVKLLSKIFDILLKCINSAEKNIKKNTSCFDVTFWGIY